MTRRIATYERVSSDNQRERSTILTQYQELKHQLTIEEDAVVVERYVDDGVSGVIPMKDRPAGGRLLRDAQAGKFDEVWVYKLDRLGRDDVDPLIVRRDLQAVGVKVISLKENVDTPLGYGVHVLLSAEERRSILGRTYDGMNRAAREGRYCGGICPLGYKVVVGPKVDEKKKAPSFLAVSDAPMWADLTEADVVRRIYHLVGVEGWSTFRVADEFNRLGIPTAYQKDGRSVRTKATQGVWRGGRIRNLVVNPVYKGELHYGRRTDKKNREVIIASVSALVSEELWDAAQASLVRNRIMPTTARRSYLLRSVIKCGLCGLHYSGTKGRDSAWYRCNGQLQERGVLEGKCWSRALKCDPIDELVWADIEAWLTDPGPVLDELRTEIENPEGSPGEPTAATLHVRLAELSRQDQNAIGLAVRGVLSEDEFLPERERIARERREVEARLAALEAQQREFVPQPDLGLLEAVRGRVPNLTFEEKQQIVRSLVKAVTVHTSRDERGRKELRVVVEYLFPEPDGVAVTCTGRDSWRR